MSGLEISVMVVQSADEDLRSSVQQRTEMPVVDVVSSVYGAKLIYSQIPILTGLILFVCLFVCMMKLITF